jgi:hypothetical protein
MANKRIEDDWRRHQEATKIVKAMTGHSVEVRRHGNTVTIRTPGRAMLTLPLGLSRKSARLVIAELKEWLTMREQEKSAAKPRPLIH